MLRVGRASADELAVELTLAPTAVARAAAQLSEAGLVALLADGESAPVDPRAGLRALTDRHTQQLDHIREEVPLLAQLFDTIGVGSSSGDGTTEGAGGALPAAYGSEVPLAPPVRRGRAALRTGTSRPTHRPHAQTDEGSRLVPVGRAGRGGRMT